MGKTNYVSIARVAYRFGPVICDALRKFQEEILYIVTPKERAKIQQFYDRLQQLDVSLEILLREFTIQVEQEYQLIYHEIEETFSSKNSTAVQAEHSMALAKACGVDDSNIMKKNKDLDDFFL